MQIDHYKEEAREKSKEINTIQQKLQEKEAEIAALKQQISSQESLLKQQRENMHQKSGLLSNFANSNEELIKALEQQQEKEIKKINYEIKVRYCQEHIKELESLLSMVVIQFYIISNNLAICKIEFHKKLVTKDFYLHVYEHNNYYYTTFSDLCMHVIINPHTMCLGIIIH